MLLLCCFVDSVNIKSPHSSSSRSESDKVSHLPEPVVKPCKLRLYNYFVCAAYPSGHENINLKKLKKIVQ